jgi:hypothetical protein
MNYKNAEGQLARWLEVLSSYKMAIKHRPGSHHQNADALSCIPCKQCGFRSDWIDLAHVNTIATESLNNETAISIQQLQEKDRDLNIVKKWLEKNERPSFCDIGKCGFVVKCLWSQWNYLRLKDSILYRESKDDGTLCVAIPFCERRRILQHSHDEKTSAHLGVRKNIGYDQTEVFWAWYAQGC